MLEKEFETYIKVKGQLLSEYPLGGFVVIKDDEVLGVYQTRVDALKIGIEKFGNVPFLVKDLNEGNINFNFSRNLDLSHASISK